MTFYGLTSYDRCKELLKVLQNQNFIEITQEELAKQIAINIGSSKFYKTVRNYIAMLINFKMIESIDKFDRFKINYEVLNDK